MQRALRGRKRARQVQRGEGSVAGLPDNSLRLDDERVETRQIPFRAVDRSLGATVSKEDGISGDARRLLAAEPPDRMQGEVHPGERRPGGRDAPVLEKRRAARDVGARIATLELIQPSCGGRASPAVEKSRLAQKEDPRTRPTSQRATRVLAAQPGRRARERRKQRRLTAVVGLETRHEYRVAFGDFLQGGRHRKHPSPAVDDGRASGAGGQSEERRLFARRARDRAASELKSVAQTKKRRA